MEDESLPCADKLAFASKAEAQANATVAKHRYGSALKTYRCRHCGLWHIASNY
jgi:hypothetical protein